MSRSKHHGCGKACGLCKPWKKWKGNHSKFKKPSEQKKAQAQTDE